MSDGLARVSLRANLSDWNVGPVEVIPDREYQEIGTYSYGRGIFHKQPRSGLEVGDKEPYLLKEGDLILQVTFAWEGAIALCSEPENGLYGSVRYPTFRVNEERCFLPSLCAIFARQVGLNGWGRLSRLCGAQSRACVKAIAGYVVPLPTWMSATSLSFED